MLKAADPESIQQVFTAPTFNEWMRVVGPAFSGAPSIEGKTPWECYLAHSNPMEFIEGIRKPLIILNAEDDMVCLPDNIREDLVQPLGENYKVLLVRTRFGSHICYREGLVGQRSFLTRCCLDFFEAVRNEENSSQTKI